ncbi:transposase family protein [Nocardia tengchongensis]
MLFYRSALPLPRRTLHFVSGLIRRHRRAIGSAWHKLDPARQALLTLDHLRKAETYADLGAGFDVSTITAWRYVTETVELLAARAPKLRAALRKAETDGHAYLVLDSTVIPIDRVAADRRYYSGKHRHHVMNLQVTATPGGGIVWVPGRCRAARTTPRPPGSSRSCANSSAAGVIVLADKGYHGVDGLLTPYKGPRKARIAEAGQPRPREATRPRRARQRPAQELESAAKTTLLPASSRATGQGHPHPAHPRASSRHSRMKKPQC